MNLLKINKLIDRRNLLISIFSVTCGFYYFYKSSRFLNIDDNLYQIHFRKFIKKIASSKKSYNYELSQYATKKNIEKLFLTFKNCLDMQITCGNLNYKKIMHLMAKRDFNNNNIVKLDGWLLSESEIILMSLTDYYDNRL